MASIIFESTNKETGKTISEDIERDSDGKYIFNKIEFMWIFDL